MAVRNVKKSLAGMEDIAQGKGTVSQTRGGNVIDVTRLDVPIALDTTVEMSALAVTKYTRARVYSDTVSYTDYIYDAADLTGITSDTGPGTWLLAVDEVIAAIPTDIINNLSLSYDFDTVQDAKNSTIVFPLGKRITIKEYSLGSQSDVLFFTTVSAATGTDDGGTYIDLPNQNLQLKQQMSVSPVKASAFGAMRNGVDDDRAAVQAAINYYSTLSSGQVQSRFGGLPANLKLMNGNSFSFCGICTVRNKITVPAMSNFVLEDGGLAADVDNWQGLATDFLLDFNATSSGGFSYNNGSLSNISIDANKVCCGALIGDYNRFHLNNVYIKGYLGFGLQTGRSETDDSHEMISEGLYVGEYDYFDEDRLLNDLTGIGINNYAHDGIWRNFVVHNSRIGVINRGNGNDFGDFHIWGMQKITDGGTWDGQVPGFINTQSTDTMVHDFKLGSCSMIIINPFLCVVDTWQFERAAGVKSDPSDTSQDVDAFVLKALGNTPQSTVFLQRTIIKNGLVHVGRPAGHDISTEGATNFLTIDERLGTFSDGNVLELIVEDVTSNGLGSILKTKHNWSVFTPTGVSSVSYDWSNFMLIPENTRLKTWNAQSETDLYIKSSVDTTAKTVTFTNYTDATYSTLKVFEQFKYIDFTIGCERT